MFKVTHCLPSVVLERLSFTKLEEGKVVIHLPFFCGRRTMDLFLNKIKRTAFLSKLKIPRTKMFLQLSYLAV